MNMHRLLQLIRDNAAARSEGEPAVRVDAAEEGDAHVYVYDVIDAWWGASAAALVEALRSVGDRAVQLHINSPGGDAFEARAMAAAIVAHPGKVTSRIDGLAASAATYLALAANEVRMTDGGMFMVHNAWTIAWGNKAELRATADLLEKVDASIAADYTRKTKKSNDQVRQWMDGETWFTAAEALDQGFVDAVDPTTKRDSKAAAQASAARWDLSAYARAPKLEQPVDPDPAELVAKVAAQAQRNRNRLRLLTPI
jgi:ATP-dependent Clp protease protease subunit